MRRISELEMSRRRRGNSDCGTVHCLWFATHSSSHDLARARRSSRLSRCSRKVSPSSSRNPSHGRACSRPASIANQSCISSQDILLLLTSRGIDVITIREWIIRTICQLPFHRPPLLRTSNLNNPLCAPFTISLDFQPCKLRTPDIRH